MKQPDYQALCSQLNIKLQACLRATKGEDHLANRREKIQGWTPAYQAIVDLHKEKEKYLAHCNEFIWGESNPEEYESEVEKLRRELATARKTISEWQRERQKANGKEVKSAVHKERMSYLNDSAKLSYKLDDLTKLCRGKDYYIEATNRDRDRKQDALAQIVRMVANSLLPVEVQRVEMGLIAERALGNLHLDPGG